MSKIFNWPVRVYYEDTDAGGVVFYANYLRFYERARTEMLRTKGLELDEMVTQQTIIFAVRSVQIEYLKPARFNEILNVTASLKQIKHTSLTFEQTISCHHELVNTASIRVGCLDSTTLRPKPMPDALKQAISYE